jgi:hypothetical protein
MYRAWPLPFVKAKIDGFVSHRSSTSHPSQNGCRCKATKHLLDETVQSLSSNNGFLGDFVSFIWAFQAEQDLKKCFELNKSLRPGFRSLDEGDKKDPQHQTPQLTLSARRIVS